jgi:permease MlaE
MKIVPGRHILNSLAIFKRVDDLGQRTPSTHGPGPWARQLAFRLQFCRSSNAQIALAVAPVFKFLIVPRVAACVVVLPFLTLFMDFAGLLGGFLSEGLSSHIEPTLYLNRAFDYLQWSNFIAPTLKTAVFGMLELDLG